MEAGGNSPMAVLLPDIPLTLSKSGWSPSVLWKTPDNEGRLSFCGCSCLRSAQEVPRLPCRPSSSSGHAQDTKLSTWAIPVPQIVHLFITQYTCTATAALVQACYLSADEMTASPPCVLLTSIVGRSLGDLCFRSSCSSLGLTWLLI